MSQPFNNILLLLKRLSVALLAYPVCKVLFYLINLRYFPEVGFADLIACLFYGLRFDLSALALLNAPFILLHMLPFIHKIKWGRRLLLLLFVLPNSISILADCFDAAYYPFSQKRTTADFFSLFGLGSDISTLLPKYLADFWYVAVLWFGVTALIVFLYNKTGRYRPGKQDSSPLKRTGLWLLLNAALAGLCLIAFRGGLQLRPIMPINAAEYVPARHIPLIVNTAFSIIKSSDLEKLEGKTYFAENELKQHFDPIHLPGHGKMVRWKNSDSTGLPNVFIIILESFSKEYIGAISGKKTHTPFLDSLIGESLVFDNAFANGKRSLEGLPAVTAGIPGLMNEPFITSIYGANNFNGIPSLLKQKGYSTAFFHGGINGTMGFDAFSGSAGFDNYYGKNEYNNDADYDGRWGIWDEAFFRFTLEKTNEMKPPFLSTLFTLSSHHPYGIPAQYKDQFSEGNLPIHKSIAYADHSLRQFFKKASQEKWFSNTLFILTADHTGPAEDPYYSSSAGIFRVPVIFYRHNSPLRGVDHHIAQHIDILPTLLSYLGHDRSFYSFGTNLSDTTCSTYAVNFINDVFQLFEHDRLLQFDGTSSIGYFDLKNDSLLQANILGQEPETEKKMEDKLKAIIQTYYNGMINNRLLPDEK